MDAQTSHNSPQPLPDVQQSSDNDPGLLESTRLLISAVDAGSWDLICELISNGNVGRREVEGSSLLHRLASSQVIERSHMLRILQKARMCGVDSCLIDSNGDTAVVLAARHENWDTVMSFLSTEMSLPKDESGLLSLVQTMVVSCGLKNKPYLLMDLIFALCRHLNKVNFSKEDRRAQSMLVQMSAEVGMWSRVCDLLIYKPDLNAVDRDGLTVLHRLVMCADSKFDSVLPVLLENGANVNIRSSEGDTALHIAAKCQKLERITKQTSYGDITHPDYCKQQKLVENKHSFAEDRYISKLQALTLLTETCATVDEFDSQGNTAVVLAAKSDNWEVVRLLLEYGARADVVNGELRSVLHFLAVNRNVLHQDNCENVVTLALNRGGLINGLDKDGQTGLHLAVQSNNWMAARYFIQQKASCEIPDSEGYSVLHRLALTGNEHQEDVISLFSMLHQTGTNLNLQCPAGNTVLHLVAEKGNWKVAKHLVDFGVDINGCNHQGFHVLHILAQAASGFHREMFLDFLDTLIDSGADVGCHTPGGESVVHLAARYTNVCMVERLLRQETVSLDPSTVRLIFVQWFVQRPKPDIAEDLLASLSSKAAAMNLRSPQGDSVMQLAAKHEMWATVDLLLRSFGGNTAERDSEGVSILYRVATSTGSTFKEGWGFPYVRYFVSMSKCFEKDDLCFLVHAASRSGNVDFVNFSLDGMDDVNMADEEGFTILHRVAQCRSPTSMAVVRRLVDNGADVDRRCSDGDTALHLAAKSGNWAAVNYLLQHGASVNLSDSEGLHVLHRLICQLDLWCALSEDSPEDETPGSILVSLLAKGALIDQRDLHCNTPLHLAVRYQQWEMAKELLMRGASLDDRDASGYTVLHRLAEVELWSGNKPGTCSLTLSQLRAHVQASNSMLRDGNRKVCLVSNCAMCSSDKIHNFYSMLHWSPKCSCLGKQKVSHLDFVDLIHPETVINRQDPLGNTALLLAARQNNWDIVERLLLKGANPSVCDNERMTVLHRLASANWTSSHSRWSPNLLHQIMDYCISRGHDDVTARDPEGNTPIHLAAKHRNMEMVEQLLDCVVNVNETDSESFTLLSRIAVMSHDRCEWIASRLMQKGADVNMNSPDGNSPLLLATKIRNWPVVSILWAWDAKTDALLQEVTKNIEIVFDNPCPTQDLFIKETILSSLLTDTGVIVERGFDGETAMQKALKARQWWAVERFLFHGMYTDPEPLFGEFVFHELTNCALHMKTTYLLVPLLPNPIVNINIRNASGDTPLNILAKAGEWDFVKRFISHGADVNMADSEGWTVIHRLAMCDYSYSYYIRLLNTVMKSVDVNKPGPDGRRAANIALKQRNWPIFWRLLLKGEDYSLDEEEKCLALRNIEIFPRRCQVEEKIKAIVGYLTKGRSDCDHGEGMNHLPAAEYAFDMCIESSRLLVAKVFLDCGDKVKLDGLISRTYRPILHCLCGMYKKKQYTVWVAILDGLLARGADINCRNQFGETVLMEFSSLVSLRLGVGIPDSLFKILVDRGASLLVVDNSGRSLLRHAMDYTPRTCKMRLVKCLVEMGLATRQSALTSAVVFDDEQILRRSLLVLVVASPTEAAMEQMDTRVLKLLIECGATSNSELFSLYNDWQSTMTQFLGNKKAEEILSLLEQSATQPRSLQSLCRVAVAGSIACGLNRKETVMSLPLPPLLRDFVAFSDLLSDETSEEGISERENSSEDEYSSSEESFD